MRPKLYRFHTSASPWSHLWIEAVLVLSITVLIFADPASAAIRMTQRSLYMNSTTPGVTTWYKVSFNYMSATPVGSVDMLFCVDPIPYHECVKPPGLDVSNATLTQQTGETGFTIGHQTDN